MSATPLSPSRRRAYAVINSCSAPLWLAMILAPRSALTRRLVDRAGWLFIGLGVAYDGLMVSGLVGLGQPLDFRDGERVRQALGTPDVFLAGWSHYIAFDLFVGRWIWEDALRRGRSCRVALLLTWLAGPAGLSLYLMGRGAPGS